MDAYGAAWISNDPDEVRALFASDASYSVNPFEPPWVGREEIVAQWTADPRRQEEVAFDHTALAAEGETGIAAWRVSFVSTQQERARVEMDGVLLLRFDDDGKCVDHREWFFKRETPL
jgi:hypothetical protein